MKQSISRLDGDQQKERGFFGRLLQNYKQCCEKRASKALQLNEVKSEWKQKVIHDFYQLPDDQKKAVRTCFSDYFQGGADKYIFVFGGERGGNILNHDIIDIASETDILIGRIQKYFPNIHWGCRKLNYTIFEFLDDLGIEKNTNISLSSLHI